MPDSDNLPHPTDSVPACAEVVASGFCIGCGVCAGICPVQNLRMEWDEFGLYRPVDLGNCRSGCSACSLSCPFADHTDDEDTLARAAFGQQHGIQHRPETGYYLNAYVGSVAEGQYRANGASGGLASWYLTRLLQTDAVDCVVCVGPNPNPGKLFAYRVGTDIEQVRLCAKSAYYPVELSDIISIIMEQEARYAIIGLPCLLKGLRLATRQFPRLRDRITVTAGLVCGQVKSKGFAGYLARCAGLQTDDVRIMSFRNKDPEMPSSQFQCRIDGTEGQTTLPSRGPYGRAWTTGQFKPRACGFCDDVFAEVGDISFMDAWLEPYIAESRGTSIVLTRSKTADAVVLDGIRSGALEMGSIAIADVITSQADVVTQKRDVLANRLWLADQCGEWHPRKRVEPRKPGFWKSRELQALEQLRLASHEAMREQAIASPSGLDVYDAMIRQPLAAVHRARKALRKITKLKKLLGKPKAGERR